MVLFVCRNKCSTFVREKFKNLKDVFGGHSAFLHSRERGNLAFLTLKAKWLATLT